MAPVGEISAELMPMTLPLRSNIGPPRVAHVDGGVGLDVAVVGADAGDPAVERRDDAGGDGAAKAIGIADREHPVADPRLGAVAPVDERQVAALDLQQREVGRLVAADDPRRIFLAVGQ